MGENGKPNTIADALWRIEIPTTRTERNGHEIEERIQTLCGKSNTVADMVIRLIQQ